MVPKERKEIYHPRTSTKNCIITNMTQNNIVREDVEQIIKSIDGQCHGFAGKTVIITGGAGFLGQYIVNTLSHLNRYYLKKKCKIISLDNNIVKNKKKLHGTKDNEIKYIKHDVVKPFNIKGSVDFIIHAAGIAAPVFYQKYPLKTIDVAVTGTRNMLELARKKKVKSFLFFSSSEIYGNPTVGAIPTNESYKGNVSCTGPRACYDESKRMGETLCFTYFRMFHTPVKVVRPFNIFGPGMNLKDYRVIPNFLNSAFSKKPLPVHVSGKQTRTFSYISDAVSGFFKVLLSDKNGEVYNVGNDQDEITMNKLAEMINNIFENKLKIKNVEYPDNYPADEPQRRCPDLTKLKKGLGYKTQIDLENGLRRTITWCQEQSA